MPHYLQADSIRSLSVCLNVNQKLGHKSNLNKITESQVATFSKEYSTTGDKSNPNLVASYLSLGKYC